MQVAKGCYPEQERSDWRGEQLMEVVDKAKVHAEWSVGEAQIAKTAEVEHRHLPQKMVSLSQR